MSGWRKVQIEELKIKDHCNRLLEAMVGVDLVSKWWDSPNKAFDGKKPRDTDINVVHSYLLSHAFGGQYM